MSIRDDVPGGVPAAATEVMADGLDRMGSPDLDVVVTANFVATVQEITGDPEYHDDRNGGVVAARTVAARDG